MAVAAIPPLVFFGTGPVAARSLELLAKNFAIEAVVTKPKPAHHRGPVPVIETADQLQIPVITAASRHELNEIMATKPVSSQLAVLIDFGIIISQGVIDYFPLGIINSHFSVLPDLRGADPITFAILSGQKQTGVSLMQVVKAMDEGPLYAFREYPIPPTITTPELTEELIHLSDSLLTENLSLIYHGQLPSTDQSITKRAVSHSRRLTKEDGIIDWYKPAEQLEREVRAFIGWPGSQTQLGDINLLITKAHVVEGDGQPGTIIKDKKSLTVQTSRGRLAIDTLKPAGKAEMAIEAFLAGYGSRL